MGSTDSRRGSNHERATSTLGQVATLAVVVVAVLGMTASVAAADVQQQETNDTYAVVQGEDCTEISPLYGNESVKSFYDYRTRFREPLDEPDRPVVQFERDDTAPAARHE